MKGLLVSLNASVWVSSSVMSTPVLAGSFDDALENALREYVLENAPRLGSPVVNLELCAKVLSAWIAVSPTEILDTFFELVQ